MRPLNVSPPLTKVTPIAAAIITAAVSSSAAASNTINLPADATLDWKATTSYSLSARTQSRDNRLRGPGNEGNENFARGDLTANRASLLLETHTRRDNLGLVVSASTFYDNVYRRSTSSESELTNYDTPPGEFTPEARRYHGGYSRFLDFYGYTDLELGNNAFLNLRAGRHVVAWGEALFMPSLSMAQGPADGSRTGVPGTEVKDQLLPEDQISFQLQAGNNWSFLGHWQYDWHETQVPEPGSYLSTSSAVGRGAQCLGPVINGACTFAPRGSDIEPGNKQGQWGIGTRYRLGMNTELGLYYLNYHDRIPLTEINPLANGGQGEYAIRYFDDIELYGATFTTSRGNVSYAGEVTYKKGAPTLVSTQIMNQQGSFNTIPSPTRADIMQTNLNAFYNVGRTSFADSVTLIGELSYVDIMDVESRRLPGTDALPEAVAPTTDELFYTGHGFAFQGSAILDYPGFTESWDLGIPISYSRQLSGRTLTGGVGGEGDHRLSVGANFIHRSGLEVGVSYLTYLGGVEVDNPVKERRLADRDYASLVIRKAW